MVFTMAAPPLSAVADLHCPGCGHYVPSPSSPVDEAAHAQLRAAQARIADLETQVRLLNQKASAAVDRWADYEDELGKLRSLVSAPDTAPAPPPKQLPSPSEPPRHTPSPTRTSFLQAGTNRLSQLLSPRKSSPGLRPAPLRNNSSSVSVVAPPLLSPAGSAATAEDLMEALSREQSLRKEAEGRLSDTSKEIEELSAALFEQANQMVADERRARAKLEERVGELERRDAEKRRRLERLETSMARIERVRTLLREKVEVQTVDEEEEDDDDDEERETLEDGDEGEKLLRDAEEHKPPPAP
ncbi:hypothetical protein S40285_05523 [Stachybotrys chlorohalonatus IBT 40285]|uniref:GDP/GTP exchange factor Sec2 N-terminal domain-containing protein n=1 Tax=Stachybotrys chlorohalonatus (strain IBT 40285) TaxID=1283841 RepID=A0A084QBD7_STAC4|nr:hypothetical protein S40285_05523 [Stachybotrys chlorohalonata IBT 40285]